MNSLCVVPKNDNVRCILKGILSAYALSAVFHAPTPASAFESAADLAIYSIYELLGSYDLKFLLLLVLCVCFYKLFSGARVQRPSFSCKASAALSVFFSLCLLLGRSYNEQGTWTYCFGSGVNFIKFLLALTGYSLLFREGICIAGSYLASHCFTTDAEHFFTHHAFRKSFLIILGSYLPFLLLSFPGNLCWDAIGQIEQVIGTGGYSSHHPLFHTLLMGGLIRLGQTLFHSYEAGLFVYMLLQDIMLAAALSATVAVLAKRGAARRLLLCLLLIYCLVPIYSNMASTALKDVPYSAAAVGYTVCLALLLESPELIRDLRFDLGFIALQILVILFRNNGVYVILLSGVGCFCFLCKKYDFRQKLRCAVCLFGAGVLAAELIVALLSQALDAAPGSKGEMLSVPFQQTARYLQLYGDELSADESAAIEAVLGDTEVIAASYDPDSADPVKALFHKDASLTELTAYFKAWSRGLIRHPAVYAEAFLVHIYGWFDPAVSNGIRYESDYDVIRQGGLFPNAEKLLIFYYRFTDRITLLAVFENVGAAVWALFFLSFYQKRRRLNAAFQAGLPLWISLLICMASPCFFMHPRYAFPILFTIPFMYGFTLTAK